MNVRLCLLVCCLALMGCASESQVVREPKGPVEEVAWDIPPGTAVLVLQFPEAERAEVPSVFLPGELLEWEHWDEEALDAVGWNVSFIEGKPVGEVELVMARRPQYRGGRGRLGGRRQPPLLNPRPTGDEIAARRRKAEEYRLVQQARERYYQALAEARARYPNHQGHQEHHFIPIYLGGPKSGAAYRIHSAYHQVITQEFRRQWPYGQGQPRPERLQQILLEVYSRHPIPQLIGISP
jgi:hypothetical protein